MRVSGVKTQSIGVEDIQIADRMRADVREETVAQIMESIERVGGLLHPIAIRFADDFVIDGESFDRAPLLVAGRHRLEAVKRLGEKRIDCLVFKNERDAKLWEIAENLHRADLTVLERDEHVAKWVELAERDRGDTANKPAQVAPVSRGGRGKEGGVRLASRELGVERTDAQRAIKVASLSPEAKAFARETGLDENRTALFAAAKETEPRKQVAVLKAKAESLVSTDDNRKPHRTLGTGNNEWYTPPRYIELARAVLGEFDVDPASNDIAQQTVRAKTFYTAETNGLDKEWRGKVWLNPPYAQPDIVHFIDKLVAEYHAGRVTEAILLTNNGTETGWFGTLFDEATLICFPHQRIRFVPPEGKLASPTQGQAFSYFGNNSKRFADIFKEIGTVTKVYHFASRAPVAANDDALLERQAA